MPGPDLRIDALDADRARLEQPSLVALLRDVVDDGGSVGFLPPLSEEDAREYWEGVAAPPGYGLNSWSRISVMKRSSETG